RHTARRAAAEAAVGRVARAATSELKPCPTIQHARSNYCGLAREIQRRLFTTDRRTPFSTLWTGAEDCWSCKERAGEKASFILSLPNCCASKAWVRLF